MEGRANDPGQQSKATNRGKDSFKISELFADERYSEAMQNFLAIMDVGRTVPPVE